MQPVNNLTEFLLKYSGDNISGFVRIIKKAVGFCDNHHKMTQMLINVYMSYYSRADDSPTYMYLDTIESLWAFLDNHVMLCPIKCFGDFDASLPTSNVLHKSIIIV